MKRARKNKTPTLFNPDNSNNTGNIFDELIERLKYRKLYVKENYKGSKELILFEIETLEKIVRKSFGKKESQLIKRTRKH